MKFSVIWSSVLGAYKLTGIFVCKKKVTFFCGMVRQLIKFSRSGLVHQWLIIIIIIFVLG